MSNENLEELNPGFGRVRKRDFDSRTNSKTKGKLMSRPRKSTSSV